MRDREVALLIAPVVAAGGCTGRDEGAEPWLQPLANERLVGAWQPADVERTPNSTDRWRLVFGEDGRWHGMDVCHKTYGISAVFEDGTFAGGQTPGDFFGGGECDSESVNYYLVMGNTARVDVAGDRAVFRGADGDELMVIQRLD